MKMNVTGRSELLCSTAEINTTFLINYTKWNKFFYRLTLLQISKAKEGNKRDTSIWKGNVSLSSGAPEPEKLDCKGKGSLGREGHKG